MSLTINTQPGGDGRQQEPEQHREHDLARRCSDCPRASASTRRPTTSRATRSARASRARSTASTRPAKTSRTRSRSVADRAGCAQRRQPDAPAHPRARRPVLERHDLRRRTRKRSTPRRNSSKKRSSASVKRRSSTASNCSRAAPKIGSRSAPTKKKRSPSKRIELEKDDRKSVELERNQDDRRSDRQSRHAAGEFGAVQDRIQYTQSNLEVYSQNLSSAVSGIVDVNMATEMTNFTKDQVLQQAGVSILAQANQLPNARPEANRISSRTSSAVAPSGRHRCSEARLTAGRCFDRPLAGRGVITLRAVRERPTEATYRRFIEGTVVETGGDGRPSLLLALRSSRPADYMGDASKARWRGSSRSGRRWPTRRRWSAPRRR